MDTRRRVFVVEDGSVDGLAHAFIEAVRRASAGGVDTSVGYLSLRASEIGVSAEDVETLVDANLMSALYGYNHRVSLDTARTCASTHRLAFESIARRIGEASRPTGAYEKRVVKAPRLGPNVSPPPLTPYASPRRSIREVAVGGRARRELVDGRSLQFPGA